MLYTVQELKVLQRPWKKCAGAQKWEGKRWFTQLSDKRKLHPYQGNTVKKITGTTELYLVFSQRLV